MQLFKSPWLQEDRCDARPYAQRGPSFSPRFGQRYGTRRTPEAPTGPRGAHIVHASFPGEREREILQLIARYDRAA